MSPNYHPPRQYYPDFRSTQSMASSDRAGGPGAQQELFHPMQCHGAGAPAPTRTDQLTLPRGGCETSKPFARTGPSIISKYLVLSICFFVYLTFLLRPHWPPSLPTLDSTFAEPRYCHTRGIASFDCSGLVAFHETSTYSSLFPCARYLSAH